MDPATPAVGATVVGSGAVRAVGLTVTAVAVVAAAFAAAEAGTVTCGLPLVPVAPQAVAVKTTAAAKVRAMTGAGPGVRFMVVSPRSRRTIRECDAANTRNVDSRRASWGGTTTYHDFQS